MEDKLLSYIQKRRLRDKKDQLLTLFIFASIMLAVLPFWTSFQDLLTRGIMYFGWYREIQETIAPYELHVVGTLLAFIGLPVRVGKAYIEWKSASGTTEDIYLIWNCVGWQSVLMLFITFISGLSRKYTISSRIEAFAIGILGTYLINLVRIALVIVVYFYTGRLFGQIFHDYFSGILTFVWLFYYWWVSYTYVLEEKGE